jgi:hypothetical protein
MRLGHFRAVAVGVEDGSQDRHAIDRPRVAEWSALEDFEVAVGVDGLGEGVTDGGQFQGVISLMVSRG